jgi:hypothetical protein
MGRGLLHLLEHVASVCLDCFYVATGDLLGGAGLRPDLAGADPDQGLPGRGLASTQ